MRGKGNEIVAYVVAYRITPAYAGKSKVQDRFVFIFQDHPRLCGEKIFHRRHFKTFRGSPPPMRGKAFRMEMEARDRRITPAYAGKRL